MSTNPQENLGLPEAPDVPRKIQLSRLQWIGIPIIMLIPLLAMLGLFGERRAQAAMTSSDITLSIEYPSVSHYPTQKSLSITLQNEGSRETGTVALRFDHTYMDNFSQISFQPSDLLITEVFYELAVGVLQSAETRTVIVDLATEHEGIYRGNVSLVIDDVQSGSLTLETFVLP